MFALVVPLLLLVVLAQVNDGGMDAKAIAMLGVLAAVISALRPLGAARPGSSRSGSILILGGRALGPGFGFCLGAISLFASALLTGGVGPWLPFQMLGAAWVGMGAGLLPRATGRRELWLLSAYGGGGLHRLRLPAQPVVLAVHHGPARAAGLRRRCPRRRESAAWARFCLLTSLGYDIPRAILTVVLILVAGRPVLIALRRMSRKAAFDAPVSFAPHGS